MKNKFLSVVEWVNAKISVLKTALKNIDERKLRIVAWIVTAVLIAIIIGDAIITANPNEAPAAPVSAAKPQQGYNVRLDNIEGKLYLSGVAGLGEEYLREHFNISPYVPFELFKIGDNAAKVELKEDFGSKDYTISLKLPEIQKPLEWVIAGSLSVEVVKSTVSVGESIFLSFSHAVDEATLKSNLSITPRVSYTVKCTGIAAEIRFTKSEESEGTYQLDFGGSLRSVDGAKISGPATRYVTVQKKPDEPKYTVRMTNRDVQIAPADKPILLEFETQANKTVAEVPAIIHTYRFDSIDKYESQAKNLFYYRVDPEDLLSRVSSDLHILTTGLSSIELENPGLGGYIIKVEYENPVTKKTETILKPVMVTDVSVYMQSLNGQSLLWANSSVTGLPLRGNSIELLDQNNKELASAVTDNNGVAIFDIDISGNSSRPEYVAMRIRDAGGRTVYIDRTNDMSWRDYGDYNRYFSYFYLDRSIYKPTDTVSFWGFVKPHAGNDDPQPKEVNVVLDPLGLNQSVTAAVDAYGMFHGELKLEQIKSANYYIQTSIDLPEPIPATEYYPETSQRVLDSEYIEVKQYEKPLFQISCSSDKSLYNFQEDVTLEVKPTFYDGTALPNYELELTVYDSYYGDVASTQTFMTGDDGIGHISFPAYTAGATIPWRPVNNRYKVRIVSDGENVVHNGNYYYMPTDIMITGRITKADNGGYGLNVRTQALNDCSAATPEQAELLTALSSRYNNDYGGEEYDFMRGELLDAAVSVDVQINYYLDNGDYKKSNKQYSLKTTGGEASTSIELPADIDISRYYYISATFNAKDARNRTVQHIDDYSNNTYASGRPPEKNFPEGYSFAVTKADGTNALEDYYSYYNATEAVLNDGEAVTLSLLYNGEPVANDGRILYTVLQDDLLRHDFVYSRSFSFTESTRWANNVNVVAAYFDGTHVYPICNTMLRFNRESAKLNVEITPGKEKYRPGETASVTVKVTDSDGRGVAGNACVSVVDEAVFALREQNVDTLPRLYSGLSFYNYNVRKYTTLTSRGIPEADGKGDIGKDNVENLAFYDIYRKNFKDTACFVPVRTDSAGYASVSFTVPDNTTSWRVTSVAIGDNLYAGNSKTNFASSLPFFVSPIVSGKYIEGDDIAMLVQGHGSLLDKDSKIRYTVRIAGDKTDLTETVENTAYQSNLINFGKLPEGEYTVVASARYGGYSDTVEIPLAVVSSNLELVVGKELDLSKPLDINAMRYPVTISFYDKEYSAYYKSISSLLTHYCMIANQRMSRFVAKRALMKYIDPDKIPQHIRAGNDDASDMQNYDGGIGWSVGDDSDILLTTQVLLVAKDQFNLNSMAQYFHKVIENKSKDAGITGEQIAASYLGLAYIGEDVGAEVAALLQKDSTPQLEKAYLIAALAYGGKTDDALSQYKKHIAPQITVMGKTAYVRSAEQGADKAKDEYITRIAWLSASKLGLDDADMIALYFASSGWRISSLFECMAYVTNYNKAVEPASFSYFVNGDEHKEELGVRGQKTIVLNKSEFETFRIGSIPPGLSATAYYIGEPSDADLQQSDKIKINKTVTPVSDNRYRVDLTLEVSSDSPKGYYDVSDWIPSNARLYDMDKTSYKRGEQWWFNYSSEGQKMYFRIYRYAPWANTMKISYFIQKTYDADTVMDRTYVIHGDSGEGAYTERYMWKSPA